MKCLIENEGHFLSIRNGYGSGWWTLPGGGVQKNESTEKAVRREVLEEVGIMLGEVRYLGEYISTRQYKRDTVHCFHTVVHDRNFKIDNNEVCEAKWFSKAPTPHASAVDEVLKLFSYQNEVNMFEK